MGLPRLRGHRLGRQSTGSTWREFSALPRTTVVADFHCVTKFSIMGNEWSGVPAATLMELAPPAPDVST